MLIRLIVDLWRAVFRWFRLELARIRGWWRREEHHFAATDVRLGPSTVRPPKARFGLTMEDRRLRSLRRRAGRSPDGVWFLFNHRIDGGAIRRLGHASKF